MTVANERWRSMQLSGVHCTWSRFGSRVRSSKEEVWKMMLEATRKCDEGATTVEKLRLAMKSASAKSVACERPKPSWSS
jgi:hypothetical protein